MEEALSRQLRQRERRSMEKSIRDNRMILYEEQRFAILLCQRTRHRFTQILSTRKSRQSEHPGLRAPVALASSYIDLRSYHCLCSASQALRNTLLHGDRSLPARRLCLVVILTDYRVKLTHAPCSHSVWIRPIPHISSYCRLITLFVSLYGPHWDSRLDGISVSP